MGQEGAYHGASRLAEAPPPSVPPHACRCSLRRSTSALARFGRTVSRLGSARSSKARQAETAAAVAATPLLLLCFYCDGQRPHSFLVPCQTGKIHRPQPTAGLYIQRRPVLEELRNGGYVA